MSVGQVAQLPARSFCAAKLLVQSYVHSGHDFRHVSAKLMQASLALAAPKIQSAEARSRFKFLPTEGGGAAVQSSKSFLQIFTYFLYATRRNLLNHRYRGKSLNLKRALRI